MKFLIPLLGTALTFFVLMVVLSVLVVFGGAFVSWSMEPIYSLSTEGFLAWLRMIAVMAFGAGFIVGLAVVISEDY